MHRAKALHNQKDSSKKLIHSTNFPKPPWYLNLTIFFLPLLFSSAQCGSPHSLHTTTVQTKLISKRNEYFPAPELNTENLPSVFFFFTFALRLATKTILRVNRSELHANAFPVQSTHKKHKHGLVVIAIQSTRSQCKANGALTGRKAYLVSRICGLSLSLECCSSFAKTVRILYRHPHRRSTLQSRLAKKSPRYLHICQRCRQCRQNAHRKQSRKLVETD